MCDVKTLITPDDNIAFQARSCDYGRAGIGRFSWKNLNTGRHEKAPVVVHAAGWLHSMVRHIHDGRQFSN